MSTTVEPKDDDGSLPGYDRYIRRMYSATWFPRLDSNGMVYTAGKAGARGREAAKNMKLFSSEDALELHLKRHFPQNIRPPEPWLPMPVTLKERTVLADC